MRDVQPEPDRPRASRSPGVTYAIALLVVGGVTFLRLALDPLLGDRMAYIFYLPALAAVGWWLGMRAYLVAAAAALAIAEVLFIPRVDGVTFGPGDWFQAVLYALVIAAMGAVIWQAQRSEGRAMAAQSQASAATNLAVNESGRRMEAEARLSAFIREVRDYAIFSMDAQGRTTSWNAGVERLLGYGRDEFVGMSVLTLFPWDEAGQQAGREELREAAANGVAGDDRWMRRKDGSLFWTAGLTTAIYHERGDVIGFTKVMRDRTEQHITEERMRQSEEHFRGIIDSAMDAIVTIDEEQRITIFNPAAERMFRCPASQALGQPLDRFIPPEHRQVHRAHVDRFGNTGVTSRAMGAHQQALAAMRADGEVFPMEATISQTNVGGRRLYTAIVRDITPRIRQERALAAANERFRLMADASPVLVWLSDTTGACVWFNRRWLEFTGRTLEEEYGQGWARGVHPDDMQRCLVTYASAFERREAFEIEYRLRRNDGEYRWLLDRGIPYDTEPGVFGGFIGACIDITEAREFRDQLARHAAALERSNADLKDFAYVVSHDLKEPLRGISNYSVFLIEDHAETLPDDAVEKIRTVQRLARRAYDLLDAILAFSRVGRDGMKVGPIEADELFTRAIENLRGRIEEEGAEVSVDSGRTQIECDPDLALQALTNLISNALKYNERSPKRVEMGCLAGEEGPVIYVRDNGIGIDPRHRDNIFRMFKRLHGRDRYGGGTGAGLAIVRRIVERHGGRIWVESEPGQGSTFFFTLGVGTQIDAPPTMMHSAS